MSKESPALRILNSQGRNFNVRLVRKDELCGEDDSERYEQEEPMIEFFDAFSVDEESGNKLGYFTGIRCNISTLFETAFEVGGAADQLFNENLPMWNISNDNIVDIQEWVLQQLDATEKQFIRQPIHNRRRKQEIEEPSEEEEFLSCQAPPPKKLKVISPFPPFSKSSNEQIAWQPQLESLIQQIDELEKSDPSWRIGEIEIRLRLLAAKENLLKILALLHRFEQEK